MSARLTEIAPHYKQPDHEIADACTVGCTCCDGFGWRWTPYKSSGWHSKALRSLWNGAIKEDCCACKGRGFHEAEYLDVHPDDFTMLARMGHVELVRPARNAA